MKFKHYVPHVTNTLCWLNRGGSNVSMTKSNGYMLSVSLMSPMTKVVET